MKNKKQQKRILIKPYCVIIIAVTILTLFYVYWKSPQKVTPKLPPLHENNLKVTKNLEFNLELIVHLDLKGAPPKISYFERFFPLIKRLGATGLLIEYEDMFPYRGEVTNISALNSYSLNEIKHINDIAFKTGLKIIPLVQTFGHMEFILKLNEFKEYREVMQFPDTICPNFEKTLLLIKAIIKQTLRLHPNSNYIHIGADEVYRLGQCERCIGFMSKNNLNKNGLFLNHINNIVNIINQLNPNIKILMWDDQLRLISKHDLKKLNFKHKIVPVVWKYSKEVYEDLDPILWENYKGNFDFIYAASAFKGATSSDEIIPEVGHYLQNQQGWLNILRDYGEDIKFNGVILTGWQRYDHFAVLCELLPVAVPSLAMSLRVLQGYKNSLIQPPIKVAEMLQCQQPYALIGAAFGTPKCAYPGGVILESVLRLQQLRQEYENLLMDSKVKGWFNYYNLQYKFSSPSYVKEVNLNLKRIKDDLDELSMEINKAMLEVYDVHTVNEWRLSYFENFVKEVDKMFKGSEDMLEVMSWPRRPFDEV